MYTVFTWQDYDERDLEVMGVGTSASRALLASVCDAADASLLGHPCYPNGVRVRFVVVTSPMQLLLIPPAFNVCALPVVLFCPGPFFTSPLPTPCFAFAEVPPSIPSHQLAAARAVWLVADPRREYLEMFPGNDTRAAWFAEEWQRTQPGHAPASPFVPDGISVCQVRDKMLPDAEQHTHYPKYYCILLLLSYTIAYH